MGLARVLRVSCFLGVVFVDDESFSTLSNSTCALISLLLTLPTNLTLIAIEGVTPRDLFEVQAGVMASKFAIA